MEDETTITVKPFDAHAALKSALDKGILTEDTILAAAEESAFGDEYTGYCLECGYEHEGVEPDARNYVCESCGARAVYGAEEIVIMMVP